MHHRLNTFFGAKHPMLWVFIDKLRSEETKQRKKWQKNDELKRCVWRIGAGSIQSVIKCIWSHPFEITIYPD
uniref:Uncharacterized protein n=1 Tax=Acrobeloides nanus TaxID=290746 RepID=A0A914DJP7_9BILA